MYTVGPAPFTFPAHNVRAHLSMSPQLIRDAWDATRKRRASAVKANSYKPVKHIDVGLDPTSITIATADGNKITNLSVTHASLATMTEGSVLRLTLSQGGGDDVQIQSTPLPGNNLPIICAGTYLPEVHHICRFCRTAKTRSDMLKADPTWCRSCHAEYSEARYHAGHKATIIALVEERRVRLAPSRLDELNDYLGSRCSQCPEESNPSTMLVLYPDPKTVPHRTPREMAYLARPWKTILKALEGGVVVCPRCYRKYANHLDQLVIPAATRRRRGLAPAIA